MKNLNKTMIKTQTTIIMLFMLFGAFNINAQEGSSNEINPSNNISEQTEWAQEPSFGSFDMSLEILDKRDITTKHFRKSDGSIDAICATGPLHYNENGTLKTIYHSITSNNSGLYPQYDLANTSNLFKSFYSSNLSNNGAITLLPNGDEVKEMINMNMYYEKNGQSFSSEDIIDVTPSVNYNEIIYKDIYASGIDIKLEQHTGLRKMDYIIGSVNDLPMVPQGATDLVFEETILLPISWNAAIENEVHPRTGNLMKSEIVIYNSLNEKQLSYLNPDIYDLNPNMQLQNDETYKNRSSATYSINQVGRSLVIKTKVALDWLLSPNREFPVIVDPSINIYTTTGESYATGYVYKENYNSGCSMTDKAWTHVKASDGYAVELGMRDLTWDYLYYAFQNFDLSSFDPNAKVTSQYTRTYVNYDYASSMRIDIGGISQAPVSASASNLYSAIQYHSAYGTYNYDFDYTGWKTVYLTASAVKNHTQNYFGQVSRCPIGYELQSNYNDCSNYIQFDGYAYKNKPYLYINYTVPSTPGLWTGATSSSWNVGSNWDDGNVPGALTNVNIPTGCPNWPNVNGNVKCYNLTVASGAYMTFGYGGNGYTLTVGGNVDMNGWMGIYYNNTLDVAGAFDATGGTIYCIQTPKIKLAGTVTSFGTFTEANSTVTYDGTSQTVKSDNYYNLVIGGSGTKTLSGNTNWTGTLTVNSTPTFNTSTRTCSSGAMVINGTLAITTGTITNSGATDINGKLTISTGLFDANGAFDATGGDVDFTSTGILKLGSTVTSLGTLTSNYGTVWYDGSSSQTILSDTYNNLSTYNSTKTVGGSVTVNDAFNLESGTVNVGANTFTANGLSNVDANLTIGTGTYNADGAFDATGGTIDFTGAGKLILSSTATSLGTLDNAMGTVEYDQSAGPSGTLSSPQTANNGASGNMFNITNNSSSVITITHIGQGGQYGGARTASIFYNTTPYHNTASGSSTGWISVFKGSVTLVAGSIVDMDINDITISPGDTYGFHTYYSGGSVGYTTGSGGTNGVTALASNSDVTITQGHGCGGMFSQDFQPRNWNGKVTYGSGPTTILADNYYGLEIDTEGSSSTSALDIDGDLTINSAASLDKSTGNYDIAGSFSNSGTFTTTGGKIKFDGTGAETCDAISNAATSLYIAKTSGGSVTTTGNSDFDKIYINSGSYIIDGETITSDNYVYVQGGTLQITSGLFNNTFTSSNGFQLSSGTVDIDGGELRIGTLASTSLPDFYMSGGTLDVSGGTLNVSDCIYSTFGTITQTGGTINPGAYTGSSNGSGNANLYKTNGTLNLTAGTLEIKSQYASANNNAIQINNGVTVNANKNHLTVLDPSGENMYMDLNGKTLGKLTIKNGGSYKVYARDNFTLLGNLTVNSGASLESIGASGDITLNGKNFKNLGGTFDLNSSTITFSGTENVTCGAIISNGAGILVMNKNSGKTLTLTGDVELNKLTLTSGKILPSTKTLTIRATSPGSVSSYVEGAVIFDCQSVSTEVELPTGKNGKYRPIFIDPASTSTTTFTGEYIDAAHSSVNWAVNPGAAPVGPGVDHIAAGYWYDIERSGTTMAKVGFDWDNTFLGIDDVPSMLIAHWNTTSNQWENIMGSNVATGTASAGSVRSELINDFSPFGGASSSAGVNPLPVDLLSFNATCSHDIVDIDFTVLSQINNDYFLVERSEDAVNWEVIGNIDGAGNTNTQMDYNFVDANPLATQGYYRLTQVDFDAKSETFWPVTTECSTNNTGLDISVYPNPILDHFTIEIDLEEYQGDDVYYTILDIRGSIVKEDQISLTRGFNKHEIQIEDLSTGAYMLRFTNTKNHIKEQRIMVK